ncbi:MAG TPA: nitroreductase family deazaflavin-dependent oxidoreductase [Nocardia sp.]|uniref:nitroreductase family deazaflavin-dependent oxidoreductase n=1 Tax=Nocardia TaxID=1817 RepID=UPI002457AEB6|nr:MULTISPECIES: nitroreductase family deazaflavin-dependent oxidoreductase [Nocardia]HLS78441.1 nitroreductase family deazaflavin-dependent oxidoreductase [Nocardia sp.]
MSLSEIGAAIGARALRTRTLVRAPIGVYRAGWGRVFGSRLLMLEHTGRRSGALRHVVLEVVDHPAPDEYVIVSGFGERAQWYRNIRAQPKVRVWIGTHRGLPATATPMTDQQSRDALARYVAAHPRAWKNLRATIERATGEPVHTLPMVLLRTNRSR